MYNKTTPIMVSACYTFKVNLILALFNFFCVYMVPFNPTREGLSTPHGITPGPLLFIFSNSLSHEIY